MKILLVEGNLDDAALVREALLEIEESRRWRGWVRRVDLVHLERIEDAVAVLAEEPFDVALVDAAAPGAGGLAPLFAIRARAPDLPVILLISDEDELLGVSAVREGAEDCILKSEIDCPMLARALRNAVERRRHAATLRGRVLTDAETGLYNHGGFLAAGGRDRKLARKLGRPLSLAVVEAGSEGQSAEEALPAPEELAAILQLSFPDTGLIARLDARRFAVLSIVDAGEDPQTSLAALRFRVALRNRRRLPDPPLVIRAGMASLGPAGDATLEELIGLAQSALCENGPSEPAALSPARRASA